MEINYLNWVRDKAKVLGAIKSVGNTKVFTGKSLKLYFPEDYVAKGMADIGGTVTAYGVCCLVLDDKYYTVMTAPTKIPVEPTTISLVTMDETKYYEYYFDQGSTFIKDTSCVKDMFMSYGIYELMISLGRYPWYLDYMAPSRIFRNSAKYAGIRVGNNKAESEVLIAITAKDPNDLTKSYRHSIKSPTDMAKMQPVFTALGSVSVNATNTTAKLFGSRIGEGSTSALVNPAKQQEKIETLLRL